jgi:hypothetical protein
VYNPDAPLVLAQLARDLRVTVVVIDALPSVLCRVPPTHPDEFDDITTLSWPERVPSDEELRAEEQTQVLATTATTSLVLTTSGDPPVEGDVTVLDLTVRTVTARAESCRCAATGPTHGSCPAPDKTAGRRDLRRPARLPSRGVASLRRPLADASDRRTVLHGSCRRSVLICSTFTWLLEDGPADLVAAGRAFIANPDLAQRLQLDAPLNPRTRPTSTAAPTPGTSTTPPSTGPHAGGGHTSCIAGSASRSRRRVASPV